jgi:hypothetical protein
MKAKIKLMILIFGIAIFAISLKVIAAQGDCTSCYIYGYPNEENVYRAIIVGDCFSNDVLCGSVKSCAAGFNFCQPMGCRIPQATCHIVYP